MRKENKAAQRKRLNSHVYHDCKLAAVALRSVRRNGLNSSCKSPSLHHAVERPGLGCRELAVRNMYRLVPAISNDMSDWLVPTQVRTSQLLSVLLLHCEDHCTQHLQPLLATLYRACAHTEREVIDNVSTGVESCKGFWEKSGRVGRCATMSAAAASWRNTLDTTRRFFKEIISQLLSK